MSMAQPRPRHFASDNYSGICPEAWTALAEAKRWHDAGHSFSVAVNIAMRNLLDDDFPAVVKHLVAESGCRPDRVILEITESGVMSDATRTIDILRQLDAFGTRCDSQSRRYRWQTRVHACRSTGQDRHGSGGCACKVSDGHHKAGGRIGQ